MPGDLLENEEFDVVVLGTGPIEALVASELADQGRRVLHIERSPHYGGHYASLTPSALLDWASSLSTARDRRLVPRVELYCGDAAIAAEESRLQLEKAEDAEQARMALAGLLENDRSYALELAPRLVRCRGKAIDTLVGAGVGEYLQFRGVDGNYIITGGSQPVARRVPESKEDVFAASWLSLIEKRKLMRLLGALDTASSTDDDGDDSKRDASFASVLAARPYALEGPILDALVYGVARQGRNRVLTAAEGFDAVRRYVGAMGRYGRMAYLGALHGGCSEVAQAFCRLCAVSGGTYILDERPVLSSPAGEGSARRFDIQLRNGSARARSVVMDPTYAPEATVSADPAATVSRALCVLDAAPFGDDSTALLTYVADGRAVSLLYMTHATMAVPSGQSVVYAWTEGRLDDERTLLVEALNSVLSSSSSSTHQELAGNTTSACRPLMTVFFEVCTLVPHAEASSSPPGIIYTDGPSSTDIDFDSIIDSAQKALSAIQPS
ncbi:hypothetical protein GGI11_006010 [Coemansia sp. RSA 2049]|nr:hypothetical protein GGI11_006010 [Coemansia sp. RSA 2049]KAJ2614557.1 hypothetical protein EV177_001999 [Coemansia sp. RSA 1804]KAJ2690265.1 hypothetical protein GGH99_002648 [Coemansia sp. RSA 1285]